MDEIEKFQDLNDLKDEVKNAALQAMEKLKKYYKYTDALPYTITTSMLHFFYFYIDFIFIFTNFFLVLDPRLKLQYYIDMKWENEYIEVAQNDLNTLYKVKYAPAENITISDISSEDSLLQHIYKRQHLINNNELEQYLAAPVVNYKTDILQWWKV